MRRRKLKITNTLAFIVVLNVTLLTVFALLNTLFVVFSK